MRLTRNVVDEVWGVEEPAERIGKNNTSDESMSVQDLVMGLLCIRHPSELRVGDILTVRSKLSNSEVEIEFHYVGKHRG